jgi:hypothetical protein
MIGAHSTLIGTVLAMQTIEATSSRTGPLFAVNGVVSLFNVTTISFAPQYGTTKTPHDKIYRNRDIIIGVAAVCVVVVFWLVMRIRQNRGDGVSLTPLPPNPIEVTEIQRNLLLLNPVAAAAVVDPTTVDVLEMEDLVVDL